MGTFNASVMHDAQSWSEGIKRYKEEKTSHFFGGVAEKPVRVKHFFKKREEVSTASGNSTRGHRHRCHGSNCHIHYSSVALPPRVCPDICWLSCHLSAP